MTLAFLRLITNPRIFEQPEAIQRAWQHVEEWLNRPLAWILNRPNVIARCSEVC
jgi:hypothetical protein